jgi:hypothetical protein
MPALVAGIHVFGPACEKGVDGRDKPFSLATNAERVCAEIMRKQ